MEHLKKQQIKQMIYDFCENGHLDEMLNAVLGLNPEVKVEDKLGYKLKFISDYVDKNYKEI